MFFSRKAFSQKRAKIQRCTKIQDTKIQLDGSHSDQKNDGAPKLDPQWSSFVAFRCFFEVHRVIFSASAFLGYRHFRLNSQFHKKAPVGCKTYKQHLTFITLLYRVSLTVEVVMWLAELANGWEVLGLIPATSKLFLKTAWCHRTL